MKKNMFIYKDGKYVAPTNEEAMQEIITADKDILKQLKVELDEDNNETHITFPPNVLPLRYYNDQIADNYYFNYKDKYVLNENNDVVGYIDEDNATSTYTIALNGELVVSEETDDVDYAFQQFAYSTLNTYNLYFPAGTKLYKHVINIGGEDFTCICPEPKSFATYPSVIKPYYVGYSNSYFGIAFLDYDTDEYTLYSGDSSRIAGPVQSITDTVTEL